MRISPIKILLLVLLVSLVSAVVVSAAPARPVIEQSGCGGSAVESAG